MAENKSNNNDQALLYLPPPMHIRPDLGEREHENATDKLYRKFKQNPFVPIGTSLTVAALCYGVFSMMKNDSRMSQLMMRARVGAQGFTIMAIVLGAVYQARNEK